MDTPLRSCGNCRFKADYEVGSGVLPVSCRTCVFSPSDGPTNWQPKSAPQVADMQQPQYGTSPVETLATLLPPDANPKTIYGMAKPALSLVPAAAKVLVSTAFADGAKKYGPANWREDPVSASTYLNAADRHISSWIDGEECAADSGVHHLAHAAACLMILLDAQVCSTLIDDRPPPAPTADLIKSLTKAI